MGWLRGLEPPTTGITIQDSNQLSYSHHGYSGFRQDLARPAGLEPATTGLEGRGSIRLSYGRKPEHCGIRIVHLHLAPLPELTKRLLDIGLTGVAFETVELDNGELPLLAPMSVIAGKIAVQVGTHYLHQPLGGKGKLLGGLPSTERGKVVVFGAGVAGGASAALAAAGGANVVVFEKRQDRMEQMMRLGNNVTALYPYDDVVAREVASADLVIGAVLVTGAVAPHVVTREMIKSMEDGSVLVDISIDQGGCFETSRGTTWKEPIYVEEGVTHFCVTNMPGAVPQTSSQAICAAILPWVNKLASGEWRDNTALVRGINVEGGKLVHPAQQGMKL